MHLRQCRDARKLCRLLQSPLPGSTYGSELVKLMPAEDDPQTALQSQTWGM